MNSIEDLNLEGKKVLLRADLNVPLDENGSITDDHRIAASIRSIDYVLEKKGYPVVCSHLGQPKEASPEFSLKPVAERLSELLKAKVHLAEDSAGQSAQTLVAGMRAGEVVLLENTRFNPGEKKNDPEYAKALANLADCYVNDAFASNHRAHASTVGVAELFEPENKGAGFTLLKEIEFFKKATDNPQRPLAAIFGGAKISTKMTAIRNVSRLADTVLVGGAMANTFFAAMGIPVGKSLYEEDQIQAARDALDMAEEKNCRIILPRDVVVAEEFSADSNSRICSVDDIEDNEMALDIGPQTVEAFTAALGDAKTIIWNGPMGAFEMEPFSSGTYAIVDALAASGALTVVGGGDTDLALARRDAMKKVDYVSTGGGAFLALLEGKTLPGVAALE